ncbi:MAG: hypothetical protein Q9217_002903 [Psora testacea]
MLASNSEASETQAILDNLSFDTGVMQPPQALRGVWIFMHCIFPLTSLVDGIPATGMHARPIECASNELSRFAPPIGQTCGQYLSADAPADGGQVLNPENTRTSEYCTLTVSDEFPAQAAIS